MRPLVDGRVDCSHIIEVHVVYDRKAAGYRAEIRCRCRKVHIKLGKVRERVDRAEADGAAMIALAKSRGAGIKSLPRN